MAESKKSRYTPAQARSSMKYQREKIDSIHIFVPKGRRDEIKHYAKLQGKSLNQFIVDCINRTIDDIEFFKDK